MKKIILLLSLFSLITLLFFSLRVELEENYLQLELMSLEEYDTFKVKRTECEINQNLLWGGIPASYDIEENLWFFYNEVPKYGISVEGDYKLAWLKNDVFVDIDSSIQNNEFFTLIVYNEFEYTLEKVKITALPLISISVPNMPTAKELYYEDYHIKWVESGTIHFYGANVETGIVMSSSYPMNINVRGATAQVFDKKAYKINIRDENNQPLDVKLSETREDNDWILNAMFSDRSRMREKFVSDLWTKLLDTQKNSQINGYGTEYVELIINNSYKGLYLLGELVDAKQENINRETDFILKGHTTFYEVDPIIEELSNTSKDIERTSTLEVEFLPDGGTINPWSIMSNYYQAFSKEISLEEASTLIDIENQIDFSLLLLYTSLIDSDPKNIFYVGLKEEDGSFIIHKEIWDLNYSMGDGWSGAPELLYTMPAIPGDNIQLTVEIQALLEGEDQEVVKGMVKERWAFLRSGLFSNEEIIQNIDSLYQEIFHSGGILRENNLWQIDVSPEDEINRMKKFVLDRAIVLDEFIKNIT